MYDLRKNISSFMVFFSWKGKSDLNSFKILTSRAGKWSSRKFISGGDKSTKQEAGDKLTGKALCNQLYKPTNCPALSFKKTPSFPDQS